jgi:hypothetical protein
MAASSASGAVTVGQTSPSYPDPAACDNCGGFQAAVSSGDSYTIPSDGVITSFAVRTSTTAPSAADTVGLLVVSPAGGANYSVVATGDVRNFAGRAADTLEKFPTRVTVHAGEIVGGSFSTQSILAVFETAGTNQLRSAAGLKDKPVGTTFASIVVGTAAMRLNLVATLEPDADHDGYGDETQDGCPGDRADHGPCSAPVISDFKFSLNKFVIDKKGAVLSGAKPGTGTTIIETLSKAAHVTFVMNLKGTGRKVGKTCKKQTSKNIKKKKCTYYPHSFKYERDLPAGTSNLGFSGRLKVGSTTKTLPVGSYVATAYPFSLQSKLGGPIVKTTFRIVAPVKH